MESSSSYFHHSLPQLSTTITTMDYQTAALLVALIFIGYTAIAFSNKKKDDMKKYPPFAPGGVWKLTKMRMTNKNPLWMLVRILYTRYSKYVSGEFFSFSPTSYHPFFNNQSLK